MEQMIERLLFASRWLLAPLYAGLVVSVVMLAVIFMRELAGLVPQIYQLPVGSVMVGVLALVDLVMVANLVILIVFAGYENFVSTIDTSHSADRPSWMGKVSFSDLKIKLMGTIVAISAIDLLKTFINVKAYDSESITWRLALHLTFVVSGVLFSIMDRIHTRHSPEKVAPPTP